MSCASVGIHLYHALTGREYPGHGAAFESGDIAERDRAHLPFCPSTGGEETDTETGSPSSSVASDDDAASPACRRFSAMRSSSFVHLFLPQSESFVRGVAKRSNSRDEQEPNKKLNWYRNFSTPAFDSCARPPAWRQKENKTVRIQKLVLFTRLFKGSQEAAAPANKADGTMHLSSSAGSKGERIVTTLVSSRAHPEVHVEKAPKKARGSDFYVRYMNPLHNLDGRAMKLLATVCCTLESTFAPTLEDAEVPFEMKQVTVFHADALPDFSVAQYLDRLMFHLDCSVEACMIAMVFLSRLRSSHPTIPFNLLTGHRLVFAALLCATKYFDDDGFRDLDWARIGGVTTAELRLLEREMLIALGYSLYVSNEDYIKLLLLYRYLLLHFLALHVLSHT